MQAREAITIVLLLAICLGDKVAPATANVQPPRPESVPLEPLAIVVNHSNSEENVSMVELRRIFLGERTYWTNGRRITLVMREPGDAERKIIVRDVCGMSEEQLRIHVLHGLYTGEILVSPKILSSPAGVRKFIFNVPGAIGYLRVSDLDSTVKVVSIENLWPGDRDYKLRVPVQIGE
jgi:ABC-type phosphate transport system substrate-binding protein